LEWRCRIEFLGDGTVDVEVFKSDGTIYDASALQAMLATHSDIAADETPSAAAALAGSKSA
jgi:hypothetical protein